MTEGASAIGQALARRNPEERINAGEHDRLSKDRTEARGEASQEREAQRQQRSKDSGDQEKGRVHGHLHGMKKVPGQAGRRTGTPRSTVLQFRFREVMVILAYASKYPFPKKLAKELDRHYTCVYSWYQGEEIMTKEQALNTIDNIRNMCGYIESKGDLWLGPTLDDLEQFIKGNRHEYWSESNRSALQLLTAPTPCAARRRDA